MISVTNLTVIWRGERKKVWLIHTHVLLGITFFLVVWIKKKKIFSALDTHCGFLHQFQASAGHQTAGPQDSVSPGVGGHASAIGEFESEPADVLSPASSAEK